MKYQDDGSPISSNSLNLRTNGGAYSFTDSETIGLANLVNKALEIQLATIREILYPADQRNLSKNRVEYKIRCEYGPRHGQEFEGVPVRDLFGGVVNFSETILTPKTQILKGNRNAEDQYHLTHDSSLVIVAFLNGEKSSPVIIGCFPNTHFEALRASPSDGIRSLQEFNGIRTEINKDGEYILTYYGGQRDTKTKVTANPSTAPTTFKISKDGSWKLDDKENQSIEFNRTSKKITIAQYTSVKPDETYGSTDSSSPGMVINSIVMDKAAKTITIKDNDGGEMKITGSKVAFGSGAVELLQKISDQLAALITMANAEKAHTHLGNLGYNTGAPSTAGDWTTEASTLTSIKSAIDGIKGTL